MKLSLLDNSSGAPAREKRKGEDFPAPPEKRGAFADRDGPARGHAHTPAGALSNHEVPNRGGFPELQAAADAGRQGLAGGAMSGAAEPAPPSRVPSIPQLASAAAGTSPRHGDMLRAQAPPLPRGSGMVDWASLFGPAGPATRLPSTGDSTTTSDSFSLRSVMDRDAFGLRPPSGDVVPSLKSATPPAGAGLNVAGMMGPDSSGPLGSLTNLPTVQVPTVDWSSVVNLQQLSEALSRQGSASFADKLRGVDVGHQQAQQMAASQAAALLSAQSHQLSLQQADMAAAIQRFAPTMQQSQPQQLNSLLAAGFMPQAQAAQLPNLGLANSPNLELWLQQQAGFAMPSPFSLGAPAMQGLMPGWISLLSCHGIGLSQRQHGAHDLDKDSGAQSRSRQAGKRARNRTVRWTRQEHLQFLRGLELYGVGKWCSVGRTCVRTRTPIQIASHYQKFAARFNMPDKEKSKVSLLDETTERVQRILKGLEKPDFPKGELGGDEHEELAAVEQEDEADEAGTPQEAGGRDEPAVEKVAPEAKL